MIINVRFAEASDAPVLAALVNIGPWPVDWTNATSNWLVAVDNAGAVLGAVCLYLGQPAGRAEMLTVNAALSPREKHKVMTVLYQTAVNSLRATGSTLVAVFSGFGDKSTKRLWKKHFGAQVVQSGNLLMAAV